MGGTAGEEVALATIIQEKPRGNKDRNQHWARIERAALFERYGALQARGLSQRQAAQVLAVPGGERTCEQLHHVGASGPGTGPRHLAGAGGSTSCIVEVSNRL